MAKYSKKIVSNICSLIKKDSYTIAEICSLVGISEETYHCWKREKPEFSEAIKKASDQFNEMIVAEAKKSLVKMIRGYTVQEKKTVTCDSGRKDEDTGKPIVKVKEHSVIDKHVQPNVAATIFALVNRDPDNWKNKQDTIMDLKAEVTGSVPIKEWLKSNGRKRKN